MPRERSSTPTTSPRLTSSKLSVGLRNRPLIITLTLSRYVRDERERPEAEGRQMSRGLARLVGQDLNDLVTTEAGRQCVQRMMARRGHRVVLDETDL